MIDFGNDWNDKLEGDIESTYFSKIGTFLASEREKGKIIYPDSQDYFKALKLCSFQDTKIVIIGQDPYSNPNEADGLAFSCKEGCTNIPYSLKQILKAVEDDIYSGFIIQEDWGLERWAKQGVLLLNRYLSVEKKKPLSHSLIGWEKFTNQIISLLSGKNESIVFLLWGSKAQEVEKLITNPIHLIIKEEHPAASGYANRDWIYNKCFSKTSKFLEENGRRKIEW